MAKATNTDPLERIEVALVELREVIAEAHTVRKDLAAEVKNVLSALDKAVGVVEKLTTDAIDEDVAFIVETYIAKLGSNVETMIDTAERKIMRRFDKIASALLGPPPGKASGPSIESMLLTVAAKHKVNKIL